MFIPGRQMSCVNLLSAHGSHRDAGTARVMLEGKPAVLACGFALGAVWESVIPAPEQRQGLNLNSAAMARCSASRFDLPFLKIVSP